MNYLIEMVDRIEKLLKAQVDIDVFFRTTDKAGDGYAFITKDEKGLFDVSYLRDRIPTDAWGSLNGVEAVMDIFEGGKQTWSKENSLLDAINQIFEFWSIPEKLRDLYFVELKDDHSALLVLTSKSKK